MLHLIFTLQKGIFGVGINYYIFYLLIQSTAKKTFLIAYAKYSVKKVSKFNGSLLSN